MIYNGADDDSYGDTSVLNNIACVEELTLSLPCMYEHRVPGSKT